MGRVDSIHVVKVPPAIGRDKDWEVTQVRHVDFLGQDREETLQFYHKKDQAVSRAKQKAKREGAPLFVEGEKVGDLVYQDEWKGYAWEEV